jgi:chromosome segregation ATPase
MKRAMKSPLLVRFNREKVFKIIRFSLEPILENPEIARLSSIIANQTNEISELNARVLACQQHYETILSRQKDEYSREKQSTVMRYAQAEKSKLDSDKRCETLVVKNNDLLKEKENLQMKLSEFKLMNTKLQQAYENKLSELTTTKKEFEKLKELNQSIDATLKSTLNHLKGESSQLKEQKEFNEKLKKDLNEQHEINEQLKEQCKQLTESKNFSLNHDELFFFVTSFRRSNFLSRSSE